MTGQAASAFPWRIQMKKSIVILAAVAALSFTGCETTKVSGSGIKGNAAKVQKNVVTILDYQGASFGSEIPQWVVEIGNGNYSADYLSSIMPGVKGKKPFVVVARGDNLEYTKQWADLVDVENQVGDEMQRIVGKAVSAAQKGRSKQLGDAKEATSLEQELNMYKQAVSAVELNGLEKIASYWIQKEVKPSKKSEESKVYYEYYAVWGMSQKLYDAQIAAAMSSVDDNTDEGKALKETLSLKLQNMMITSNDETVSEEADEIL